MAKTDDQEGVKVAHRIANMHTFAVGATMSSLTERDRYVAMLEADILAALSARTSSAGAGDKQHRFGSPPEPVVNPSEDWCDAYADWYYQGSR